MTNYIFVMGGVLSGLGKGIVTSSLGFLLKSKGFKVTSMKIDPYINIDAGTMRPTEHGEVWVTKDGGEIDQDLGNYERFLDVSLSKDNNLTTGKVYDAVIRRERKGDYLGKTVQIIPHIPEETIQRIKSVSKGYDFCLIELGGTCGDIENTPFLDAFRRMKWVHKEKVANIIVVYIPVLSTIGEQKTKPAQHAVSSLRAMGINPDFMVTRSSMPIDDLRKDKLVKLCNLEAQNIIDSPDVNTIYKVPLVFEEQDFGGKITKFFKLPDTPSNLRDWTRFVNRVNLSDKKVKIAIVGKYVSEGATHSHEDVYLSVKESLIHAAAAVGVGLDITQISSNLLFDDTRIKQFDGIVVPGGFGASGIDGKLAAIKYARVNKVPFLGLCYGMQLAVVEYARDVCGLTGAHTTEIDANTPYPVIDILSEQKNVHEKGGTMRLGAYPAQIKEGTQVYDLYKKLNRLNGNIAEERHRHRYEVNPKYIPLLEEKGLVFSGFYNDKNNQKLAEFIELPNHPYFIATQAHPEFTSRPLRPNPLYFGFIQACALKTA